MACGDKQQQVTGTAAHVASEQWEAHQGRVAQVVEAALIEDLGTSLEPHGLAEAHTVLGQELRGHNAQSTQQGPAGMDHLQPAVAPEGLQAGQAGHRSCL